MPGPLQNRMGGKDRSKQSECEGWCWHLMVGLRVLAVVPPSGTVHMTDPVIRPPGTVGTNPARLHSGFAQAEHHPS